jgi:hypothetical protein
MKNLSRLVLICCVATLAGLAGHTESHAQTPQASSYQAMSDKFFDLLQKDNAQNAVDYLFTTNPELGKMTDQAEQLKAQFEALRKLAGPYVSHSVLVEKKVAGMSVYQHYFVAYQRQPISVRISYYKSGSTWQCYSLQFDAKLTEAVQRSADENLSLN